MRTKVRLLDRMWVGTVAVSDFRNLPAQTPESMTDFLRKLNRTGHPTIRWAKRPGSWQLDEVMPEEITVDAPGLVVDLRHLPDDQVRDRIVNGDLLDHPRWRIRTVLSATGIYFIVDHSAGNAPTMLILSEYLRKHASGQEFAWTGAPVARYRHLLLALGLLYASRKAGLADGYRVLRESMAASSRAMRGTTSVSVSRHQFTILPDAAFDDFSIWRKKHSPSPSAALGVLVAFLRSARRHGLDLDDFVVEGSVDLTRYDPKLRRFGSNLIGYVSLPARQVTDDTVSATSTRWNRALGSGAPGIRVLLRALRTVRSPGPARPPGDRRPSPAARRLAYSYIRFPGMVDEEGGDTPVITTTQFSVAPGCINVTTDPVVGGQIINVSYDETYVDGATVRATLDHLVEHFIELLDEDEQLDEA